MVTYRASRDQLLQLFSASYSSQKQPHSKTTTAVFWGSSSLLNIFARKFCPISMIVIAKAFWRTVLKLYSYRVLDPFAKMFLTIRFITSKRHILPLFGFDKIS